jgi:hypothetical protein
MGMLNKIKPIKTLETSMAAFSFGQMQDFIAMHRVMAEAAITIEDLTAYVTAVKGEMEKTWDVNENMPDCPICGGKLGLQPIKAPQGRANINGWKSLWFCLSEDCTYEKYSSDDVKTAMLKKEGNI